MIRNITILSFLFLLGLLPVIDGTSAYGKSGSYGISYGVEMWVLSDNAYIRFKPSIKSKQVCRLERGEMVKVIEDTGKNETILDQTGNWVKVWYQGKEGYMFGPQLMTKETASSARGIGENIFSDSAFSVDLPLDQCTILFSANGDLEITERRFGDKKNQASGKDLLYEYVYNGKYTVHGKSAFVIMKSAKNIFHFRYKEIENVSIDMPGLFVVELVTEKNRNVKVECLHFAYLDNSLDKVHTYAFFSSATSLRFEKQARNKE